MIDEMVDSYVKRRHDREENSRNVGNSEGREMKQARFFASKWERC